MIHYTMKRMCNTMLTHKHTESTQSLMNDIAMQQEHDTKVFRTGEISQQTVDIMKNKSTAPNQHDTKNSKNVTRRVTHQQIQSVRGMTTRIRSQPQRSHHTNPTPRTCTIFLSYL